MDAISFVLGVDTKALRGANLLDLVHKNAVATPGKRSVRAFVEVVMNVGPDKQVVFRRSILSNNTSEYRFNNEVVTVAEYEAELQKLNILARARNCLVFQVSFTSNSIATFYN